ncbi:hypothetical protein Ancab_009047 [Ancistrocladus abbreviatus]
MHMAHSKISILLLLLLLISSSSGICKGLNEGMSKLRFLIKEAKQINSRKLLDADTLQLDYDYAGPNPKHDPRKGKGGGNRNP